MVSTSGQTYEHESTGIGTCVAFEDMNEPGCYICNWSGHMLRVPEDAIRPGRSPLLNLTGTKPLYVTKLSSDPYVAISKARSIAADLDVAVDF
jgi:hypothetical protein